MRKKLPLISGILNVLEKLKGNTGIIENTSVATHTIAAGKYVIWKNDLYKASSAISIGDTLSLSNLTAVSDGIANELNSNTPKYISGTLIHTIGSTGINYTVPEDCWLMIQARTNAAGTAYAVYLDSMEVFNISINYWTQTNLPAKKGQVITDSGSGAVAIKLYK